jgi:cell division transport system ATP-binding protein
VLRDISIEITRGEFVFVLGPSASGKSTLLRLIRGEERPDAGRVAVAGRDISRLQGDSLAYLRRNIGYISDDPMLVADKTAYENVAYALEIVGRPPHVVKAQVPAILELVGLSEQAHSLPEDLTRGEQQRVSIARAFANRPMILLADEPTSNLDPATSVGIMRLLDRINRTGTTVVMATRDRSIVDVMQRRVIELRDGEVVLDQFRSAYQ